MSRGLALTATIALSTGLACTSCTDEYSVRALEERTQILTFAPTVSDTWSATEHGKNRTRSLANSTLGSIVDIQSQTVGKVAGKPLYLHITTTEGIEGATLTESTEDKGLRAAPVTDMKSYGGFGMTAYFYASGQQPTGTPNLMDNEHINVNGSTNTWKASTKQLWLPSKHYNFYAWAPYGNTAYVVNSPTDGVAPTLSVTIPTNVAEQKDLLVAKAIKVDEPHNGIQPLNFNHALTAVKFITKDISAGIQITSITLEGVRNKGTYDLGKASWTLTNAQDKVSFTQTLSFTSNGTKGQRITEDEATFMMLPQTFDDTNQLTIKIAYKEGERNGEITGKVANSHKWEAGKTVTYEINSHSINNSYTFTVKRTPSTIYVPGGSATFTITSTMKKGVSGTPQAIGFKVAEIYDEATKQWTTDIPEWFNKGIQFSGAGGENTNYSLYIASIPAPIPAPPGQEELRNALPKGTTESPYTLEDEGGKLLKETANCYVIQAPGYYSLPLIYGNAITNGITNTSAYTSTVKDNPNVLSSFINHKGEDITKPELPTPVSAGIVWQDVQNLVSNVRLDASKERLLFDVKKDNIKEGNAVIAVYEDENKSTAIWSWHIWVTAQDVSKSIPVKMHTKYGEDPIEFMPFNLGEARDVSVTYPARKVRVKFVQVGSNKTQEVTFNLKEGEDRRGARSPYYQWGRKDPFIPSNGYYKNQTWYDANGNLQEDTNGTPKKKAHPAMESWEKGKPSISQGIAHPDKWNTLGPAAIFYNQWNMNNTKSNINNNPVQKTIYDPSPRGYALPPTAAFTGFTQNGDYTHNKPDQFNVVGSFDSGWYFKTGYSDPDKIYFRALGERSYGSYTLVGDRMYGRYWTAGPSSGTHAYRLEFESKKIWPQVSSYPSNGFPVRPAKVKQQDKR